jgi:hypothetical protein
MEVKKERQGVFATVGIATCAVCPRDCSMYMSSLALMLGCFEGFSKVNHNQTMYQSKPTIPETIRHAFHQGLQSLRITENEEKIFNYSSVKMCHAGLC